MPALLTRMSSRWKVRSMCSANDSTECKSVTSHSITELFPATFSRPLPEFPPPLRWMAAAVCSRASRERPHRTVCEPSSAGGGAIALPMPRPAPVTTATWPARGGLDAVLVKRRSSKENTRENYSILDRVGCVSNDAGWDAFRYGGGFGHLNIQQG